MLQHKMMQSVPGGGHGQCSASGVHAGHCGRHHSACGRSLQRCHLHCPLQHHHWLDTSGFQVVLQWNTLCFLSLFVCVCVVCVYLWWVWVWCPVWVYVCMYLCGVCVCVCVCFVIFLHSFIFLIYFSAYSLLYAFTFEFHCFNYRNNQLRKQCTRGFTFLAGRSVLSSYLSVLTTFCFLIWLFEYSAISSLFLKLMGVLVG